MPPKKKKKAKKRKKKIDYPKISEAESQRRAERCKVMQAKAAYEKTVVFRVVVDHFENKKAIVRFEYKETEDQRYRPSKKRLHYVWRDISKYYKEWQYRKKKEELPLLLAAEKAAAITEQQTVKESNELDEVLVNG